MAANNTFSERSPPSFDKNRDDYPKWKKKFNLWETITEVEKKKRGSILVLRLDDETQESVLDSVSSEDLQSNEGANKVITYLDSVFLKNTQFTEFQLYEDFETYRRPDTYSMDKFIDEFEKRWTKTKNKGTQLSENVLAYRLLKSANLSETQQQLLIATVQDNTYEGMKNQIRKVFVGKLEGPSVTVKMEPEDIHLNQRFKEKFPRRNWTPNTETDFKNSSRNWNSPASYENKGQRTWYRNKEPEYKSQLQAEVSQKVKSMRKKANNPTDRYGNITRCWICESVNHYARYCPDRDSQAFFEESTDQNTFRKEEDTFHAVTLQQEDGLNQVRRNGLVRESLGSMVLDCGASRNVCGKLWYSCYVDSLLPEDKRQIKEYESNHVFRFGDGNTVKSIKTVEFPALIGQVSVVMVTDVVDCNIPFLLSMNSMREAGMDLRLFNDTVVVFGQTIKLSISSTGHYLLSLGVKSYTSSVSCEPGKIGGQILFSVSDQPPEKIALKLHRQFSHPSADRLIKLVKDQGKECDDIVEAIRKVTQECKICQEYRKPPPRPIVGLPIASRFNQCIAMDLKQFKNVHLLHIIDHATRLSAGAIIRSKKPSVIVNEIFRHWIGIYGAPESILSDNGGEFNNPEMREFGEKLNINIKTTAAESPWSNGLVERHNCIIGSMIDKTVRDINCSLELALSWSLAAHNSLANVHGFSPFQLVFSRNPTLPCLQNSKPPALNAGTSSDIIRRNLEALHTARQAFVASESSEKVRRALSHNIRTSADQKYFTNDKVYYKRQDSKNWKGPGVVLGQEGQQVLVKHGGVYIRVHPCRLSLVKETFVGGDSNEMQANFGEPKTEGKQIFVDSDKSEGTSSSGESQPFNIDVPENTSVQVENQVVETEPPTENIEIETELERELNNLLEESAQNEIRETEPETIKKPDNQLEETEPVENRETERQAEEIASNKDISSQPKRIECESGEMSQLELGTQSKQHTEDNAPLLGIKLKEGMKVKYKDKNTGRNVIVELGKRAGKASGKYKGEWNVRSVQGARSVVNFEKDISSLEVLGNKQLTESHINYVPEEMGLSELYITQNKAEVTGAKIKELESWRNNNVYEEVPFEDQQCISSKWVIKPKIVNNEHKIKARLVLKGYEEEDCFRTDAPCGMRESVRLLLAITATMKWELRSVDFKTAFLQGDFIEREVFMIPPKEANSENVWKIRKAVYGLNDGPRQWYVRLRNTIIGTGCAMNSLDPGLFTLHIDSKLCGLLVAYVDDILWSGNTQFQNMVISELIKLLEISVENSTVFDYVGIQLKQQDDKTITLNQHAYIDSVDEISITNECDKQRLLDNSELKKLRRAAGQLNWAANISRPDMGFAACEVATSVPKATVSSLINANKWIRHLKNDQSFIKFPSFSSLEDMKVIVYTDASYANLPGGASQGGQLVFLTDGSYCAPILWHSRKIRRVVKNTLGAETLSLAQGAESAFLIAKIASEVIYGNKDSQLPVTCVTDNLSLYQSGHTTNNLLDDRLKIDMAIIREMVSKNEITLEWVPGSDQVSDVLTKKGASNKKLIDMIERGHF